jgi:hypothetical protein
MARLTYHEMEMLLKTLGHYMDQDLRGKVMRELPLMYNKWVDQEVMIVRQRQDEEDVTP